MRTNTSPSHPDTCRLDETEQNDKTDECFPKIFWVFQPSVVSEEVRAQPGVLAALVCQAGLCGRLPHQRLSLCSHSQVAILCSYRCSKLISSSRYLVPDVPDALKQRIQREAFICNELTIREEDLSKDNEDEETIEEEEMT